MPHYVFKCTKCGLIQGHILPISQRNNTQVCVGCTGPAERNIEAELASMGGVDATTKERVRYSKAMGVNPEQIAEAERNFPGSEYVKSGPNAGDLIIRSRQHKLAEMKRRGFEEF